MQDIRRLVEEEEGKAQQGPQRLNSQSLPVVQDHAWNLNGIGGGLRVILTNDSGMWLTLGGRELGV